MQPLDDIIIIDDDILPVSPPVPKIKNKDNKDTPVAKNRALKRQMPEDTGISKIPRNNDMLDISSAVSDYSEANLRRAFGGFGEPLQRQLICPLCKRFKSKRIRDFICHLYQEMQIFRLVIKFYLTYRLLICIPHFADSNARYARQKPSLISSCTSTLPNMSKLKISCPR